MLETCVNQAAGLQGMAPAQAPRLVAFASHADQPLELPLLWGLCTSWTEQGLTVLVLDGNSRESQSNPGLLQQLENHHLGRVPEAADEPCCVLPAANGLAQNAPLTCLAKLFQDYGVVVIYGSVAVMLPWLRGQEVSPLVMLSPMKSSALTAYRALKQLLIGAQLRPTVAHITLAGSEHAELAALSMQHFQQCVQTFLGFPIKALTLSAGAQAACNQRELQRLALQLLEDAPLLERAWIPRTH